MPIDTKPEDKPAAVCFHVESKGGGLEVTCALHSDAAAAPYRVDGGAPHFESQRAFKARVVEAGMSPAVAEDWGRSFNATARQLKKLGFAVEVKQEAA